MDEVGTGRRLHEWALDAVLAWFSHSSRFVLAEDCVHAEKLELLGRQLLACGPATLGPTLEVQAECEAILHRHLTLQEHCVKLESEVAATEARVVVADEAYTRLVERAEAAEAAAVRVVVADEACARLVERAVTAEAATAVANQAAAAAESQVAALQASAAAMPAVAVHCLPPPPIGVGAAPAPPPPPPPPPPPSEPKRWKPPAGAIPMPGVLELQLGASALRPVGAAAQGAPARSTR